MDLPAAALPPPSLLWRLHRPQRLPSTRRTTATQAGHVGRKRLVQRHAHSSKVGVRCGCFRKWAKTQARPCPGNGRQQQRGQSQRRFGFERVGQVEEKVPRTFQHSCRLREGQDLQERKEGKIAQVIFKFYHRSFPLRYILNSETSRQYTTICITNFQYFFPLKKATQVYSLI